MTTVLTLSIPDDLASRAQLLAAATNRKVEDAVVEWLRQSVTEPASEPLSDAELLTVCGAYFDPDDQKQLSDLLDQLREQELGG